MAFDVGVDVDGCTLHSRPTQGGGRSCNTSRQRERENKSVGGFFRTRVSILVCRVFRPVFYYFYSSPASRLQLRSDCKQQYFSPSIIGPPLPISALSRTRTKESRECLISYTKVVSIILAMINVESCLERTVEKVNFEVYFALLLFERRCTMHDPWCFVVIVGLDRGFLCVCGKLEDAKNMHTVCENI